MIRLGYLVHTQMNAGMDDSSMDDIGGSNMDYIGGSKMNG